MTTLRTGCSSGTDATGFAITPFIRIKRNKIKILTIEKLYIRLFTILEGMEIFKILCVEEYQNFNITLVRNEPYSLLSVKSGPSCFSCLFLIQDLSFFTFISTKIKNRSISSNKHNTASNWYIISAETTFFNFYHGYPLISAYSFSILNNSASPYFKTFKLIRVMSKVISFPLTVFLFFSPFLLVS